MDALEYEVHFVHLFLALVVLGCIAEPKLEKFIVFSVLRNNRPARVMSGKGDLDGTDANDTF